MIIALLWMGVDGIADRMSEGHPHADELAHHIDAAPESTPDVTPDHCEHCCHGHTSSLTQSVVSASAVAAVGTVHLERPRHIQNLDTAPPTPPPTA